MAWWHWVRVGLMGRTGRFRSADSVRYERGARVACRTDRGIEVGQVLGIAAPDESQRGDGVVLRALTVEDQLLLERLHRHRDAAVAACQRLIAENGLTTLLMDIEPLLDGQSIYFYFLGEITPELEQLTPRLVERYRTETQLDRFAQTLQEGCGPGCGDAPAGPGGEPAGHCIGCAVAAACCTGRRP